jgi:transposase-like protein
MTAVREFAACGATGTEIARQTGLAQNRVSEARTILRLAPDLADAVAAGRVGLSMAYRAAVARQAGPVDLAAVKDVTVAQMARLLHVYPDTVHRAIRRGDLETDPNRRPTRIPAAAARVYLAAHGVTSDRHEDLLRPAAAASARGRSTSTLARSAGRGRLPAIRTPGGHHRYPAAPP